MATIINNPPASSGNSTGVVGMIIGLVILAVLGYLFIVYGIPAMRNMQGGGGGTQINVPDKVDINVQQSK